MTDRDSKGRLTAGHAKLGGRKKLTPEMAEAMEKVRTMTPAVVDEAARLLFDPKTPVPSKIRLIEMFLDRGLGKPRQAVEIDAGEETGRAVQMTLEEKLARIKEIAREYRDDE